MTTDKVSMTKAREILAQQSGGKKNPVDIKNPEVLKSGLFKVISGPGPEAPEYTQGWVLEIKRWCTYPLPKS